MSLTLLQSVWQRFPDGGSDLLFLTAVAEAANDQGNCYVTMHHLAAAARLSRAQAFRALRQLKEERWIVASRIVGQGGTLVMQINLGKLARSMRADVDLAALDQKRARAVGATEADLMERVRDRKRRSQDAPAKRPGKAATPASPRTTAKPAKTGGGSGALELATRAQTPLDIRSETEVVDE